MASEPPKVGLFYMNNNVGQAIGFREAGLTSLAYSSNQEVKIRAIAPALSFLPSTGDRLANTGLSKQRSREDFDTPQHILCAETSLPELLPRLLLSLCAAFQHRSFPNKPRVLQPRSCI
jgi:hypothetical protein